MIIHGAIKEQTADAWKALNPALHGAAQSHLHGLGGPEWVLVADERQAWLFARAGGQVATLGRFVAHEAARSDLAGASDGAHFDRRHDQSRYQPPLTETRQHELHFMHEVAQWLEKALTQKAFARLIVVAGPRILGEWRREASPALLDHVQTEIGHDLAGHDEKHLLRELPHYLPGPARDHQ